VTTTYVPGARWEPLDNRWESAKKIIGERRVTLGPQASQQWLDAPDHLAMVLSRYRAAAALIGDAQWVAEFGCGEGLGFGILSKGREHYCGLDTDVEAVDLARSLYGSATHTFLDGDVTNWRPMDQAYDAVVSLDVLEHVPAAAEQAFMLSVTAALGGHGVCVIGTPSKYAEAYASPQSRAGHVNLKTPAELKALMGRYFNVVQMVYSQDTSLHLGHPGMAHYLFAVGVCPKIL
jgi:2-polyprenyl-3-methyl-5-hydroxy-6-metoxy-1,4-benzoquinol methylase